MTRKIFPEIVDMKSRIHKAYKILEEKGYFCGYSFACCTSCGWSEIPDDKDMGKVVFFHNQDEDYLKERGYTHLKWSGDAGEIMGAFGMQGVFTLWNGSPDNTIIICHPSVICDIVV